jgi:1-acyl-sn-glycerol-3-phosphate acyltransferase
MSPWLALFAAIALLAAPRVFLPRVRVGEDHGLPLAYWWLNAAYCAFMHRYERPEVDPLPRTGPALLICNHTCSIDHVLLQAATRRMLGFLIAKELYDYWLYRPFCAFAGCIPVKRDGRDVSATRAALRMLEQGRVVPIFPEGKMLPRSGRELGEGKPGVAYLALTAKVPVIPAYLRGTPPETSFARALATPSSSTLAFGPPIDLSDFASDGKVDRDQLGAVTERLMDALRALQAATAPVAAETVAAEPAEPKGGDHGPRPGRRPGAVSGYRAAVFGA